MNTHVIVARDADEKEKWIEALENTILRHSQPALVRVHFFSSTLRRLARRGN